MMYLCQLGENLTMNSENRMQTKLFHSYIILATLKIMSKIVSEYDQEIPQSQTADNPPGGLNAFYWYQIFTLDSAVVEVQEMFSSHGGHLTNAMYHHGETL